MLRPKNENSIWESTFLWQVTTNVASFCICSYVLTFRNMDARLLENVTSKNDQYFYSVTCLIGWNICIHTRKFIWHYLICCRLIAICEDINDARAERELGVEEVLYWTLIKIYRSPHMLLEDTKPDEHWHKPPCSFTSQG